jgi:hypothetical protein
MYNEREALAYSGKLPAQQAAITPQLLDLLAMQKVKSDKDAAARQLAMVSGQTPPTVAKGLEQDAMNSARQEIAQKMGLAGLAQSQPPAGPMPQGLAGAPTNLPTQYRGGGIIAFAEGGSGGDAHGRFRQREVEQLDVPVESEDQGPQMSAEKVAFGERQSAAVEARRDQDPEALGRAEIAIQESMLSPNREAAIARKREQQAGLKALYERQIAERPSGLRVALDRMAQNIYAPGGFGGAMQGVSQAGQAAREGYTKQEINQLNALSVIDDEIAKAIANDDVDKYNAYVARKKEVRSEMSKALELGTTMTDVNEKVTAGLQRNYETVQGRKQAAATLAQQRAEALDREDKRIRDLANDRLMQLKIAQIGAGGRSAEANDLRITQLRADAYKEAAKEIAGSPMYAGKSFAEKKAAIEELASTIIEGAMGKQGGAKSATGMPANATYGKVVPGKGTEVFVNGVLKGYAN